MNDFPIPVISLPTNNMPLPEQQLTVKEPENRATVLNFSEEFAFQVALLQCAELTGDKERIDNMLAKHGVSDIKFRELCSFKPFQDAVTRYCELINSGKVNFELKLQVLLDDWLVEMNGLMRNPLVPASEKINIFKTVGMMAGKGNKENSGVSIGSKLVVNISVEDRRG